MTPDEREPHAFAPDDSPMEPGCYYCGRLIGEHRHAYQPSNLDDESWPCLNCGRAFTKTPEHFDGAEPVR
jgi:hypothetical protein